MERPDADLKVCLDSSLCHGHPAVFGAFLPVSKMQALPLGLDLLNLALCFYCWFLRVTQMPGFVCKGISPLCNSVQHKIANASYVLLVLKISYEVF